MHKRTWSIGSAAILLTLLLSGTAASGETQFAQGAGPLLVASNGNPLREVSCDVTVGGGGSRHFEVAITRSQPPTGGPAQVIKKQTFWNVPSGQTRTLMTSNPMVPNLGPIFCIVKDKSGSSSLQRLFVTLSSIDLWDNSIETVVGASGNTSIPN